jgi:hypothetical protein
MLPAMAFYLLVHIGEAGYVFSFLPATLIAAGAGLARAAEAIVENLPRALAATREPARRAALAVGLAALVLPYHTWLFVGSGRLVSAERLACKDEAIAAAIGRIRADFPPATTEIVTSTYLQHLAIYLPEYGRVRFLEPDRDLAGTPAPGVERVVVFDLEIVQRSPNRSQWTLIRLNRTAEEARVLSALIGYGSPLREALFGQRLAGCGGYYHLATVPAAGTQWRFDAARFTIEVMR